MTMLGPGPLSQQIISLLSYLDGLDSDVQSPKYTKIAQWVRDLPPASRPPELIAAICRAFKVPEAVFLAQLEAKSRKGQDFDALVPPKTWLSDYMDYTRNTEPPSVFHFFAGCVAIGSVLGRNVYFDKGPYQVYPNLAVLVIAPSGRCRKTSACNLAMSLLRKAGGNVLADKTTPEALVEAFKEKTSAVGTIYAPEFSVFLGKQKYQEGMIPMLTALFDCPKEWRSATITRGEIALHNVAFSLLGCSTMDWIQTAIPKDAFGGGFMSRMLFVIQQDTPRSFPLPPSMDLEMESRLVKRLRELTQLRGAYALTPEAREWYVHWYNTRGESKSEDKQFAGYEERKPDHMLRLAMCIQASRSDTLELGPELLARSLAILEWLEEYLPTAFGEMNQTNIGEEHGRLLRQLSRAGGKLPHSEWLRKNSNRMGARQFREYVDTLRSARLVEYDPPKHVYFLTNEGWNEVKG